MGMDPVLKNIIKTCLMSGSNPWSSSLPWQFGQKPDVISAQADLAEPKSPSGKSAYIFLKFLTNRYRLITCVLRGILV